MGVRLEGQNLVIPLDDFQSRVVEKAMPLLGSFLEFQTKVVIQVIFLLLQTDRQTMEGYMERINAGEDPNEVMGGLIAQIGDCIRNNPKLLEGFDALDFEEFKHLFPEKEE